MSKSDVITTAMVVPVLAQAGEKGMKVAELAAELGTKRKQDLTRLRALLGELMEQGSVMRRGRGIYVLTELPEDEEDDEDEEEDDAEEEEEDESDQAEDREAEAAEEYAWLAGERGSRSRKGAEPLSPPAGTDAGAKVAPKVAEMPAVTGRITVHPAGYGFVAVDDGTEDIFVPAKYRGQALDGDRVELSTWQGYKGTEGMVVRILSRGRAKLTGTLRRTGRTIYLEPDDPRIASSYGYIPLIESGDARIGKAAVIEICRYPTAARPELVGRLVRILGAPEDPRTEIEKIITCADIPTEIPTAAMTQAEDTPQELGIADFADRIDLRDKPFVTIDPERARDFDDALCIEDGPGGLTRVWVAVADVSHYVRTDDALDQEASIRGVSVYLPDRVIPMLPMPLSSGICSLNPDVDRCAMVVRLDFAPDGQIRDTGFAAAVIRSHARLDYPGVAAALSGDFRGRRMHYQRWAEHLARLDALARVLRARRIERGALMLDMPEARVILDADDPLLVRDVVRAKSTEDIRQAYSLVEEFMIAANEAVGEFFRSRDLPAVWRVHAPPEVERLEELANLLRSFGIKMDVDKAATAKGLRDIVESLGQSLGDRTADSTLQQALSFLILRSLKQAVYDTVPIGHFALASPNYLHFTSPIRRYPDLLVHRLLKAQLHKEGQASGGARGMRVPDVDRLQELAHAASQCERRAMEAEREAVSMYRAYLMRDQVGETFPGRISAVTSFGAFVELDEPFVEGLIKADAMGDDTMGYDAVAMRLRGRKTGLSLRLGDSVLVQVTGVSVVQRRVDMALVSVEGKAAPRGARAAGQESREVARGGREAGRGSREAGRGGRETGRGSREAGRGGRETARDGKQKQRARRSDKRR